MDMTLKEAAGFINGYWLEPAAGTLFNFNTALRQVRVFQKGGAVPVALAFGLLEEDGVLWAQIEKDRHRVSIIRQPNDVLAVEALPGELLLLERAPGSFDSWKQ